MDKPVINAIIPIKLVDFSSILKYICLFDDSEALYNFLTDEIEKAGGNAVIEVNDEEAEVKWVPPEINDSNAAQVVYVSHMLQAGLLKDATQQIANTIYDGNGVDLARALLLINAKGLNTKVAEKDARTMVVAAPLFSDGWIALALIQMENNNIKDAAKSFQFFLTLKPDDVVALRYLAICLTESDPKQAVSLLEKCINKTSSLGLVPDKHLRVTYGMALRSAKMKREATAQFALASINGYPKMTIKQWIEWGHRCDGALLDDVLSDPLHFQKKL